LHLTQLVERNAAVLERKSTGLIATDDKATYFRSRQNYDLKSNINAYCTLAGPFTEIDGYAN
jgi:hypothetical protein